MTAKLTIKSTKKYDLLVKTAIITGEKPTKAPEGTLAANQHQLNKLVGFLPTGEKVLVAQRPGKGGMDFTKLVGGKIYAVAADSITPVLEKDKDGKVIKGKQRSEDGLPYYTTSGFYSLSTKDMPSVKIYEAYTLLRNEQGDSFYQITDAQLQSSKHITVEDVVNDSTTLLDALTEWLDDKYNLCKEFDTDSNKKRNRRIQSATQEAEDNDEEYKGIAYKELAVSAKDGNPFVMLTFRVGDRVVEYMATRDQRVTTEKQLTVVAPVSAVDSVQIFAQSAFYQEIQNLAMGGVPVTVNMVQGHVMRTSVAFKRKVENLKTKTPQERQYGDSVFLVSALQQWTKGVVNIMYSFHPSFPTKDYEALYYVAAIRQAELGMTKLGDKKFSLPEATQYDIVSHITL